GLAHLGPHARCLRFAVWLPVQLQTPRKTRFRLAVLHLGRSGFSPAGRYDWFRCYITSSNPRLYLAQVRLRLSNDVSCGNDGSEENQSVTLDGRCRSPLVPFTRTCPRTEELRPRNA